MRGGLSSHAKSYGSIRPKSCHKMQHCTSQLTFDWVRAVVTNSGGVYWSLSGMRSAESFGFSSNVMSSGTNRMSSLVALDSYSIPSHSCTKKKKLWWNIRSNYIWPDTKRNQMTCLLTILSHRYNFVAVLPNCFSVSSHLHLVNIIDS